MGSVLKKQKIMKYKGSKMILLITYKICDRIVTSKIMREKEPSSGQLINNSTTPQI